MEKTREFIQIHLQSIINAENEGVETSIIYKEDKIRYLEKIWKEYDCNIDTPIQILETGFGAGFAAVYFLFSNPNIRITCIDEGYHRYSYACFEKIREKFGKDRIRFYLGNSNVILPLLKEKYDIIHYDGSGTPEIVEKDFLLSYPLFQDHTIVLFSNNDLRELWEKYANIYHLEKIPEIESTFFRKRSLPSFSAIPKKIHRVWLQTTDICDKMQLYSDRLRDQHPDFEYIVYDLKTAREYLLEKYDAVIVKTYDSLVPMAYKADFFRYCVLYMEGGIYLDMKFECINEFDFHTVIDREQYVLDIDNDSIYNAFLICKPASNIMFKCIFQIIKHVREKDYTENDLSITGPGMMKYLVSKEIKCESKMRHQCINYNKYITRDGIPILKNYHRYYEDTPKCGQKSYYEYWINREVFLDIDRSLSTDT